jgi:hypothetical protein
MKKKQDCIEDDQEGSEEDERCHKGQDEEDCDATIIPVGETELSKRKKSNKTSKDKKLAQEQTTPVPDMPPTVGSTCNEDAKDQEMMTTTPTEQESSSIVQLQPQRRMPRAGAAASSASRSGGGVHGSGSSSSSSKPLYRRIRNIVCSTLLPMGRQKRLNQSASCMRHRFPRKTSFVLTEDDALKRIVRQILKECPKMCSRGEGGKDSLLLERISEAVKHIREEDEDCKDSVDFPS